MSFSASQFANIALEASPSFLFNNLSSGPQSFAYIHFDDVCVLPNGLVDSAATSSFCSSSGEVGCSLRVGAPLAFPYTFMYHWFPSGYRSPASECLTCQYRAPSGQNLAPGALWSDHCKGTVGSVKLALAEETVAARRSPGLTDSVGPTIAASSNNKAGRRGAPWTHSSLTWSSWAAAWQA
jgi:hypothetical protein